MKRSYFIIKLDLKSKITPSLETSLYFSYEPVSIYDTDNSVFINVFPILKEVSNLGQAIGDFMPKQGGASFTILNNLDSLSYQLKFTDLLSEYSVLGMPVTIYLGEISNNNFNTNPPTVNFSDLTIFWADRIENLNNDINRGTLRFSLFSNIIDSKYLNYIFDSQDLENYFIDQFDNEGASCPVCVGANVQIKPILFNYQTSAVTAADAMSQYFTATDFYDSVTQHKGFTLNKVFAKDYNNDFVEIENTGEYYSTGIELAGATSGTTALRVSLERGFKILNNSSSKHNFIITSIEIPLGLTSGYSGSKNGTVCVKIYAKKPADDFPDIRNIGTAVYDKTKLTSTVTATCFHFDNPVILDQNKDYFFTVSHNDSTSTNTIDIPRASVASTIRIGRQLGQGDGWSTKENYAEAFKHKFFGVKFSESGYAKNSASGKSSRVVQAYVNVPVDDGSAVKFPNLKNFDLIFEGDGLKDDDDGIISGTPNKILTSPIELTKLALRKYINKSWTSPDLYFDSDLFSESHSSLTNSASARNVSGVFVGQLTNFDFINFICQNSLCKIALGFNNSKVGLYAFGNYIESKKTIRDKDAKFLQWLQKDLKTVVNNCTVSYGYKVAIKDPSTIIATGQFRNYSGVVKMNFQDNDLGEFISAKSYELYGDRQNANMQYQFLADLTSARNVAKLILSDSQHPYEYIRFAIPFFGNEDLQLFDCLEIESYLLPSKKGSSRNVDFTFEDSGVTENAILNRESFRGSKIKIQIQDLQLNLRNEEPDNFIITGRILNNDFDPTK